MVFQVVQPNQNWKVTFTMSLVRSGCQVEKGWEFIGCCPMRGWFMGVFFG